MTATLEARPSTTEVVGASPLQTVRGDTHVTPRAILRIAMRVVQDVPHVRAARATGLGALASAVKRQPGIQAAAETGGGWASIHLRLVLDWPCPIRAVADDAARVVAARVQALTGVRVDSVDIDVVELHLAGAPERRVQ